MRVPISDAPFYRSGAAAALGLATLIALAAGGCSPRVVQTAGRAPTSDAVVATIPISSFGTGIALTPDGSRAFVAASANVVVIDTAAGAVSATIRTGDVPYAIAVGPDGSRAAAINLEQNQAWIFDVATNQVLHHVWLGGPKVPVLRPGIAITRDGTQAIVTISQPSGQGGDVLRMIDMATGEAGLQRGLDFHPGQIQTSDGRAVVVGCHGFCSDGTLHVIDPRSDSGVVRANLASVPGGVAVSPDGRRAFAANANAASVSVIDLASGSTIATVPVGAAPLGVAVSPDGSRAYVANFDSGTLSAIDTATNAVIATRAVGANPRVLAIRPDGRTAYLTHSIPQVSVIDLSKLEP